MVTDRHGQLKEHPLVGIISKLRSQKIAALRAAGFLTTKQSENNKTANMAALKAVDVAAKKVRQGMGGKPRLLAVPD